DVELGEVNLSHILREDNVCADFLVKFGPEGMDGLLQSDSVRMQHPRL
ncbi:hypothetical protein A2U01_0049762, partial [Trifolium medium]|nr:hypothetical protein [Trifolium medium]